MTGDVERHPVHIAAWWPENDTPTRTALDPWCEYCGHPISYGQPLVEDEEGLWHRSCWLDVHESKPQDFGTSVAEWYPCPEAVQWAGVA